MSNPQRGLVFGQFSQTFPAFPTRRPRRHGLFLPRFQQLLTHGREAFFVVVAQFSGQYAVFLLKVASKINSFSQFWERKSVLQKHSLFLCIRTNLTAQQGRKIPFFAPFWAVLGRFSA